MALPTDSFSVRLLGRLAHAVYHRPNWFLYPQIFLFVCCVAYTAFNLEFSTKRRDLVGANKKYHQNFLRFKEEFPGQDDLAVLVESEGREKNRQFVERLGARLEAEPNLFADIFYRNDLKMLGTNALLFADEASLTELNKTLKEYRPFIEKFAKATNLVSLFDFVNRQFRTAPRPAKTIPESQSTRTGPAGPQQSNEIDAMIKALPALERIIRQAGDSLVRTGTPPSPGINALFGRAEETEQQIYLTFARGRIYLVSAHAPTEQLNFPALERLRVLVRETQVEVPGVNAAIIGEPVLEYDEMQQSKKDTTLATVVSLVLCALIFIYGYQETGRPVKATICLIIGLGYTMGFTTLVVGHLNILTITFAPMLIGMAIDFGVHLVTRYEEELRHGKTEREALEKAMVFTGQGISTGCFTTAGAFLAMGLTDFKGIREMGIIAGGGMLICLVPMMTMLPVLLLRGKQNVLDHKWPAERDRRARIERLWLERPIVVGCLTAGLCALALTQFRRVYFDYNLLHMQSPGLPSVEYTMKFLESGSNSVLFAAVISDSVPEAIELESRLTNLTTVASVKSMAHFLSGETPEKLMRVGEIKREVSSIQFAEPDIRPVDVVELSRTLFSLKGYLGLALEEVRRHGEKDLENNLQCLRIAIEDFQQRLAYTDRSPTSAKLAEFQQALFTDLRETFDTLK
ncbi:MAG: MMPL family transporter, partial [Verrucomicrobiota bacterium]